MKKAFATLCVVVAAMHYGSAASAAEDDLPVLDDLNATKLFGHYYEIATYLQWIESGCSNSAVSFVEPTAKNAVAKVTIECDRNGNHQSVKGNAIALNPNSVARTEVTFKGPLGREIKQEFDMIIAGVPDATSSEPGYPWLVIGHPSRRQLWIISRTADLPTTTLTYILTKLESDFGYTNVRKNITCTAHDNVPASLCGDALQTLTAWDENWLN